MTKPSITKFRKKTGPTVEAVPLLWSTWGEVCALIDHLEYPEGLAAGCYIDANGCVSEDETNGRIELRIPKPSGILLAIEGDWIIREGAEVWACRPHAFHALYESLDPSGRELHFEPDWKQYPRLATIFEHQSRENVYWEELQRLLVNARADGVRFIQDVKMQELAKARTDTFERTVGWVEAHSAVSSCCDAQPSAGEAKALADCLRRKMHRLELKHLGERTVEK